MTKPTRQEITDQNEDSTRQWFELSDFQSQRLDKRGKNTQKTPDWIFEKENLTLLCEVKTIFSGGQQGLTREQYERQRAADKKRIDEQVANLPEGQRLILTPGDFDYLQGKIPYKGGTLAKEDAFQKFEEAIETQLISDDEIAHFPFRLTISIDGLYVPPHQIFVEFIKWLKGFVLWAQENHNLERVDSSSTFTFQYARTLDDGSHQHSIEAFVQMRGPYTVEKLSVGFIRGGVPYHEQKVAEIIEDAMAQLPRAAEDDITTIGLWSASSYLWFSQVFMDDAIDKQLGRIGSRYYLFDWAFSQYPHLGAIILFELRRIEPSKDFWAFDLPEDLLPFGYVITNPFLPAHETILQQNITQKVTFIKGIEKDPLYS